MPRLRNKATGAVVSVSDPTAARLGSGWVPADEPKSEPAKAPTKNKRKTASDD